MISLDDSPSPPIPAIITLIANRVRFQRKLPRPNHYMLANHPPTTRGKTRRSTGRFVASMMMTLLESQTRERREGHLALLIVVVGCTCVLGNTCFISVLFFFRIFFRTCRKVSFGVVVVFLGDCVKLLICDK
jgi:hypothetical protein